MFNSNDKILDLQAQIQKLNDEAADQFHDASWRADQAQRMSTDIYQGFKNANIVDLFTHSQYLGRNETATRRVTKGLRAFHVARGGYIKESTITEDVMYIEKDQIGFHFVEHLDRLEVGFVPRTEQIISLGAERINSEVSRRVLKAFEAAAQPGNSNYIGVSGLGLAQLNNAITKVQDAPAAGLGQTSPVIVTRSGMVNQIVNALTGSNNYNLYLPQTNEELLRRGSIGSYRSVPIVQLPNWTDEFGRPYFAGNELYVVSKDAAMTAFHGSPRPHNYIENGADYWHYIQRIDYGVSVVNPDQVVRVVDANISA